MAASWLRDAIFYEIYPQSFFDSNGDGIGDLNGIRQKLDYVRDLGCSALWLNPCFDSPFRDAGYDVRDYCLVAPRYGTNADLEALFQAAHDREMHVILDLVAGHTSEEHPWFLQSQRAERNAYSDRYIWTDFVFRWCRDLTAIAGESERSASYITNFFKCQPALNYGFLRPTEPEWQQRADSPAALETREALKDIMRFWLDRGCDGFRVDMAASLVKHDDAQKSGTSAIWRDVRAMLDRDYPQAVLVSEWDCPQQALTAGFDCDFYLNNRGNGYTTLMRDYINDPANGVGGDVLTGADHSYFKKDAGGDIRRFLSDYLARYEATRGRGYISLITCNHDTVRPSWNLDRRERELAFAFLFTMPGVPFLYYGDEIGMRYLPLPTKEGGYFRTGSRTPMQWSGERNLGFSTAPAEDLYLPVDDAPDAPNVAQQMRDGASFLSFVRQLLALRRAEPDLQADAPFSVVCDGPDAPFVYRRGSLICAVNPSGSPRSAALYAGGWRPLFETGSCAVTGSRLDLGPQSFAVLRA